MIFYLDRIEGNYCVFTCNGNTVNIPINLIPDAKEGDKYSFTEYTDNHSEETNEKLVNKLFE